jgi:HK97 gp10 family phage protein
MSARLVVRRSVLEQMPAALQAHARASVAFALRAGEQTAKQQAPVRTGFLRNSITTTRSPQGGSLVSRANYSAYVNFGTRYMAARPYFTAGVTRMREVHDAEWRKLERRLPRL